MSPLPDILLVHGMGRTPVSMFRLARRLRRPGRTIGWFVYSVTFERYDAIVRRLVSQLARSTGRPLILVAHSLGGLLLRDALRRVPGLDVRQLVMLGTPQRPPRLALRWAKRLWYRALFRDSGQRLADPVYFAQLPLLIVPYTIVVGNRTPRWAPLGSVAGDGIVAIDETAITPTDQVVIIDSVHTFLMHRAEVATLIERLSD